jgi:hypothetical protein
LLPVLALEVGSDGRRRWGDGFEVESLINIRIHSAGLKVTEVPSYEAARLNGSSNLRAFADGWRVLSIIAREGRALRKNPDVRVVAMAQLVHERNGAVHSELENPVRAIDQSHSPEARGRAVLP